MDKIRGLPREQKMLGVGAAMIVFIISLFLKWFGTDAPDVNIPGINLDFSIKGTEIDSWWIILIIAIVGGGIYVSEALNIALPVRWAGLGVGALATFLVFFWTIVHMIDGSNLKFGAWLALIVSVIGSALATMVWNEERT